MRREMIIPYLILFVSLCAARPQDPGDRPCAVGEKFDPIFTTCSSCEEGDDLAYDECRSARPQDSGDSPCDVGQKFDPVFTRCSSCEEGDDLAYDECRSEQPEEEQCPSGQIFDPVFENCKDCDPQTDNCEQPEEEQCPSGQIFDPVFENCKDCDPQTDNCGPGPGPIPGPKCPNGERFDPVFTKCVTERGGEKGDNCFESISEIEQAIFKGETRQAFNDCDETRKCSFYKSDGYECAPSWTCHNQTIITDGKGLIDVRQADDDGCASTSGTLDVSDSKCDNVQHVCCQRPNFRVSQCEIENPPEFGEDRFKKCGRSGGLLTLTGVDKFSAQPGEFPHMCIIYRRVQGANAYVGGASLIGPNKVVTVAHKFLVIQRGEKKDLRDRSTEFYVRCGEHNVKNEEELQPSQESSVEEIIIHPQYDARRVKNNLAILRTKENFVYDKHIGPVCLPRPYENFAGQTECFSSGWGANDYSSTGFFSDALKKVQMPIVATPECQNRLRATDRFKNKPNFNVDSSWVCVGGEEGSDTCKGDGGSPHVCKNGNGDLVQVGAVAWGIGCGGDVPSVYSSIPDAMCWLDWVMSCIPNAVNNIDSTFVDELDIRGAGKEVNSVNGLMSTDCKEWVKQNFELTGNCEVIYDVLDQRSGQRSGV